MTKIEYDELIRNVQINKDLWRNYWQERHDEAVKAFESQKSGDNQQ